MYNDALHLNGWLKYDWDGIPSLDDRPDGYSHGHSIIDSIRDYAYNHGMTGEKHTGLGGHMSMIRNCNLRVYFTEKKCSLEEAMQRFDALLYGGDLITETSYVGYSEYTITGMDLDEFTIGGHDLTYEFDSHMGQYVHLILEC